MPIGKSPRPFAPPRLSLHARGRFFMQLALAVALVACAADASARQQQQQSGGDSVAAAATRTQKSVSPAKLPSPEKIVDAYFKASGGKKRLAAVRDATYEWEVEGSSYGGARARTTTKAPAAGRTDLYTDKGELTGAASAGRAWRRAYGAPVQTLTGREAYTARLQALLLASRLVDYKKLKVAARTVGLEQMESEPAYVVEFSTREGGRGRAWFGASSKLVYKIADAERGTSIVYGDHRPVNGILEPHRAVQEADGSPVMTLTLRSVRHNTGLSDAAFEPPGDEALDVASLLRDLQRNQRELDRRVGDYTFTRKMTERKVNDRGEVTKETVTVHEVYPVAGSAWVTKLVSENGAPLSPERAAKEEKRVIEALTKAEREQPKLEEKRQKRRAEREAKRKKEGKEDEDNVGVAVFLRASEFVAPRRERFGERDVVVFDFRPRPGFKPANRGESVVSKLAGTVWIDPADRQVMRLEAHFAEGFKIGGGLLASIKPGSAFVFEQARMPDGVWLPHFSQVNLSAKVFLFAGINVNQTQEFSDYKRFSTKADDPKLDAPEEKPERR